MLGIHFHVGCLTNLQYYHIGHSKSFHLQTSQFNLVCVHRYQSKLREIKIIEKSKDQLMAIENKIKDFQWALV